MHVLRSTRRNIYRCASRVTGRNRGGDDNLFFAVPVWQLPPTSRTKAAETKAAMYRRFNTNQLLFFQGAVPACLAQQVGKFKWFLISSIEQKWDFNLTSVGSSCFTFECSNFCMHLKEHHYFRDMQHNDEVSTHGIIVGIACRISSSSAALVVEGEHIIGSWPCAPDDSRIGCSTCMIIFW